MKCAILLAILPIDIFIMGFEIRLVKYIVIKAVGILEDPESHGHFHN